MIAIILRRSTSLALVTDKNSLEFSINDNGEHYLDLAYTLLFLKIKVLKNTNSDLGAKDNVAPIN